MGTLRRELGNLRRTSRHSLPSEGRWTMPEARFSTDEILQKAVDILEVCAGCAVITRQALRFGLRAGQPIDILYGWDLLDPSERSSSWITSTKIDLGSWCASRRVRIGASSTT